jgi:Fe-S-cluster-containing dehydrogenase component
MNIRDIERGKTARVKVASIPVPCMHCQDAPCEKAAQNGAVTRRPDGIVLIDPVKAKGQKQLVEACPYGAVYWNEGESLPQKCTMCAHFLDAGYKEPRCVEVCPTGALTFGDLDDPESEVSKKMAGGAVVLPPGNDSMMPLVKYLNVPGMLVAGTIFLTDVKECAKGARVTLSGDGTVKTVTANGFGDFEFEDLPKGAEYFLTIEMPGYAPWKTSLRTDDHWVSGDIQLKKL